MLVYIVITLCVLIVGLSIDEILKDVSTHFDLEILQGDKLVTAITNFIK